MKGHVLYHLPRTRCCKRDPLIIKVNLLAPGLRWWVSVELLLRYGVQSAFCSDYLLWLTVARTCESSVSQWWGKRPASRGHAGVKRIPTNGGLPLKGHVLSPACGRLSPQRVADGAGTYSFLAFLSTWCFHVVLHPSPPSLIAVFELKLLTVRERFGFSPPLPL